MKTHVETYVREVVEMAWTGNSQEADQAADNLAGDE